MTERSILSDYLNEYIEQRQAKVSKRAFRIPSDELVEESQWYYDIKNHPTPWRSLDDEDLTQRK